MKNAPAVERAAVSLVSIKPPIGTRLQIKYPGRKTRLSSELLGYRAGGSVVISQPSLGGKPVELAEGTELSVRMITGTSVYGFSSPLLCSYAEPFAHWHLKYPADLSHKKIRQQVRVPVNLVVSVDEFRESTLKTSGQWPRTLLCRNLSLSGANLMSKEPLGAVGDQLYLTLRLVVAGADQVVLAPCVIRNAPARKSSFQYGVEFFDLDEEVRLVLAGFVYQQCLLETGYQDYLTEAGV